MRIRCRAASLLLTALLWMVASSHAQETSDSRVSFRGKTYPLYPQSLEAKPDVPSPCTTNEGIEIVIVFTTGKKYALVPVTVENGTPLNYRERQWGKGRQLEIDAADFPTLAMKGLHSEAELDQTKAITGRSIAEITELGRPGRSSGAGFMSDDEDIVSVLKGDNRIVDKLGLTHPQMAKPLFHVWNTMLKLDALRGHRRYPLEDIDYVLYNGRKVYLIAEGSKGWQDSIFDDEILGTYRIEMWRELDQDEKAFLHKTYATLAEQQMTDLCRKLSSIHTGEMVPYYIMRYGFYEGHTSYRVDPVAVACIFGLKGIREIEESHRSEIYDVLVEHFTQKEQGGSQ